MEEINQLKRDGLSILAISNLTGYDRKTIRKYLSEPTAKPEYPPRPRPAGKLEPFKAYLSERLQEITGSDRYRPSLWLRCRAMLNLSVYEAG